MTDELRTASETETQAEGHLQGYATYAEPDWQDYLQQMHVVQQYLELAAAGEPPPDNIWRDDLHTLGEARRQFTWNAGVQIHEHIQARTQHLASVRHDLDQVRAALEDVEQAIHDGEEAEHLAHLVLKLKDLAEFAQEPTAGHAWHVVHGDSTDSLIEQGIGNLGHYDVLLTLASHGFASVEELHRRVVSANEQVTEAAHALATEFQSYDDTQQYYNWPAFQ